MKILLINANPVVSRLFALCTRDAHLMLEEVTCIGEIKDVAYDLIFVDDGSYVGDIDAYLEEGSIRKKVFISYVKEVVIGFDETMQKPFLPSQVIKVIEGVDRDQADSEKHSIFPLSSEEPRVVKEVALSIFPFDAEEFESAEPLPLKVLDGNEIEKIRALLDMDDEDDSVYTLSEDEVRMRKVKMIKEQLISEGLEILDEDEIIDVLSTKTKEKKEFEYKKNKLKQNPSMLHYSEEEFSLLESAVRKALTGLEPKKMKKFLKGKEIELKIKIEGND